jgi:predicted acyl esterase
VRSHSTESLRRSRQSSIIARSPWKPERDEQFFPGTGFDWRVSSSNFSRLDRNMNAGGKNYDESKGVFAHNAVHHSKQYPSELKLTVVRKSRD